ncbi:DNA polymerase IV [Cellulosilyticum ruminicola]|uniref:DNA polymerase IV n=1 Tax=Cellulosilyticum ruminicola TaxID=425254 RepID=UPI0006D2247A|nr:DNA polymerase IV [Cellulosilyticum ruminicola]
MNRIILHCDLNNFFASVECLLNPDLKHIPMVVGGSEAQRHGVVLAKNELAKKYGIITGESLWSARQKCPELVTASPHHDIYVHYSKLAREVYSRFTDLVEPFGIDECWLDITGSTPLFGNALQIAETIRQTIKKELGLTISIGISFNKVFAKLGSDFQKPDAITSIPPQDFKKIIWPLPVSDILGAGKATTKKLTLYSIRTIGDLAQANPQFLKQILGENGLQLWQYANGLDTSPVHNLNSKEPIKSIGNSTTLAHDLTSLNEVRHFFMKLSEKVSTRLRHQELLTRTVQIWVKDANFNAKQYQKPLPFPSCLAKDINAISMELFEAHCNFKTPIRALGIRALNLKDQHEPEQMSLFELNSNNHKIVELENSLDLLKSKYGTNIIKKGF